MCDWRDTGVRWSTGVDIYLIVYLRLSGVRGQDWFRRRTILRVFEEVEGFAVVLWSLCAQ